MLKKSLKYIVLALIIALLGYNSVYFKKLGEVKKGAAEKFDAAAFAKKLWEEQLPAKFDSAVNLWEFMDGVYHNPATTFAAYTNAMSIGNYRYALVKATVIIEKINEDDIIAHYSGTADTTISMVLATEYIYSNAIRDASGLVNIKDFSSTGDLNDISSELNKIARIKIAPALAEAVKPGDKIEITAAIEINKEHINFNGIELIPVRFKILP